MLVGLFVLVSILTDMDAEQTSPAEAMNDEAADSVQMSSADTQVIKVKSGGALETPNRWVRFNRGCDAPIKIYEYASLTCVIARRFIRKSLPDLKKQYVDTGLVQFNFRPFPLDPYAMTGAMLVQCAIPQARLAFLETLFKAAVAMGEK